METITSAKYRCERQKRGTQKGVALSLGVDWRTIQRREAGDVPVSREAWIALRSLPLRKTKTPPTRKGQNKPPSCWPFSTP